MAIGDPYVTLAELKEYVGINATTDLKDEVLQWALGSATQEINNCCEREFNKSDDALPRTFRASHRWYLDVDDFYTVDGLTVNGVAYNPDHYDLLPANGFRNGVPGWPFNSLEVVGGGYTFSQSSVVTVVAHWGWAQVPDPIRQACFMMAAKNYKLADAPTGVAGFGEFGVVRVREMPDITNKLRPYKRTVVNVG